MDKRNFTASWVNFGIILTLALSGFYMVRSPLESSRPRTDSKLTDDIPENKTVLRSWEDPFNCLEKVRLRQGEMGIPKRLPEEIEMARGFQDLANDKAVHHEIDLLIQAVMVPGRNFEDRVERRVRSRVAVHAALSESGFVPFDSETLGYFTFRLDKREKHQVAFDLFVDLCCQKKSDKDSNSKNNNEDKFDKLQSCPQCQRIFLSVPKQLNVPYEWFRAQTGDKTRRVLVLWINEDEISGSPVHVLTSLKHQIEGTFAGLQKYWKIHHLRNLLHFRFSSISNEPFFDVKFIQEIQSILTEWPISEFHIIGPWHSSTLRTVCEELEPETDPPFCEKFKEKLIFYNVIATAKPDIPEPQNIHRIVSSDEETAEVLARELQRRIGKNVRGKAAPQFVLIAEHDTYYGRTLPETFGDVLKETFFKDDPRKSEDLIARYTYLRGLDGTMVSDADTGNSSNRSGQTQGVTGTQSALANSGALPARPTNRSFGNNQIDYIIRLAEQIKRRNPNPRAIGILGSDTYDKLLLLNELKRHFPFTIFFTTDLDAVLMDVQETKWTKNLLVASSHGLRLHESLQKNTPEFRSNYQTSMFQGTRASVEDRLGHRGKKPGEEHIALNRTSRPRIFEVGINRVHDLSCDFHDPRSLIHPKAREFPSFGNVAFSFLYSSIGVLFFVLIFLCFGWSKLLFDLVTGKWIDEVCNRKYFGNSRDLEYLRRIFFGMGHFGKGLLVVTLTALVFNHFLYDLGGEPFVWMDGVSIWPTVLIQLFTLVLGWGFFVGAIHRMRKTRREINEKLGTVPDTLVSVPQWSDVRDDANTLFSILKTKGYKSVADFVWNGEKDETKLTDETENKDANALWIQYRDISRFKVRSICVISFFPIFILSMIALSAVTSWTSCRSLSLFGIETHICFWIASLVWLLSWGILFFLAIFVAAENYSCSRFVSKLRDAKFRSDVSNAGGMKKNDYPEWRDIDLIGSWTQENNHLMLQPAVILFCLRWLDRRCSIISGKDSPVGHSSLLPYSL